MFKAVAIFVVCAFALAQARPNSEIAQNRGNMQKALNQGLARFEVGSEVEGDKDKVWASVNGISGGVPQTQYYKVSKTSEEGVRASMRNAFRQGLAAFEGGSNVEVVEKVHPQVGTLKPHVYSQYTKDITAAGGGKPAITDQYRQSQFVPLVPTVVAPEHKVLSDKPTPEEAAAIYVPHPPLQYTTERLH